MFAAELQHRCRPSNTKTCLQGTWFVVDAGVNDATVVAALVVRNFAFFFEHKQFLARKPSCDFERHAESDNACSNNDNVVTTVSHCASRRNIAAPKIDGYSLALASATASRK